MLASGVRLGPYEILGPIGAGGMGEVYRARDTRLEREVAIKVLPVALAADPERLARLTREAKTLAALNHPNIAAIHGLEEEHGVLALAMELVPGDDLAQLLLGGPLPLDEALPIARQIAEALEAAHEHGIVHRDLKPANIKVRSDGTVKVLDFGLAKVVEATPAESADIAASPTLTARATVHGVILGTAAYMAPEQAKGRAVDKRADLWALGVVLYEMLSGRRAFAGEDVSETLAAVLRDTPDLAALPSETPASIRRLLRRCLVKDPKQRLGDAAAARLEIDDALGPSKETSTDARPGRRRERLAWATAAAMTLAVIVLLILARGWGAAPRRAASPEVRFQLSTPTPSVGPAVVSPDGRQLAYLVSTELGSDLQLWLRRLDADSSQQLLQTSSFGESFWSPEGRSLAFFADQKLKRLDLESGAIQTLAEAPNSRGGSWNSDGTILFAPGSSGPLFRVAASGGEARPVTRLADGVDSHRFPRFLPDGRHFLFWCIGPAPVRGEYVGALDSPEIRRLFDADGPAVVAWPDQLLYVRESVLLAQRLDLDRLELAGDPVPVASPVAAVPTGGPAFSASANGVVVYRPANRGRRQIAWRDRAGRQLRTVGEPLVDLSRVALSPDQRWFAISRFSSGPASLWLMDAERGALSRVTSDASGSVWSPDGRRIAFSSGREGIFDLYWRDLAAGADEPVLESTEAKNVMDWSPDGGYLLYAVQSAVTARDLWALPLAGSDRRPIPVTVEEADEADGRFSPDGKWVAYVSNETGAFEVYVRPFPGPARAQRISISGGRFLAWRRDGKELYYVGDGKLFAVPIATGADGIDVGSPTELYAVAPGVSLDWPADGERFLATVALDDTAPPPITVIVNWQPGSRAR